MRALGLSPHILTILLIGAGCSPVPKGDGNQNLEADTVGSNNRTGGNDRDGTAFTTISKNGAEVMEQLRHEIPPNPSNVELAGSQDIEIRYLDGSGHEVESMIQAERLWVVAHVKGELYQFTLPLSLIQPGQKEITLQPVISSHNKYDASIECQNRFCTSFLIHLRSHSGSPSTPTPQSATLIDKSDAEVTFKTSEVGRKVMNTMLAHYPEFQYILQYYTKPALITSESSETVLGGTTLVLRIPLLNEALCLSMKVKKTNNEPTDVTITCGQRFFSHAQLAGNNEKGWIALTMTHVSGLQLVLDVNRDPEHNPHRAVPAKAPLAIGDSQLDRDVNSQAYLKQSLQFKRTRAMEALLQGETLEPSDQAELDKRFDYWKSPKRRKILQAFFSSNVAVNPEIRTSFEKYDLPLDMTLATLKESAPFWTDHLVQLGPIKWQIDEFKHGFMDCPVGPLQLFYPAALEASRVAQTVLGVARFNLIKPAAGGCQSVATFNGDARTDFIKAAQLQGGYLYQLAQNFHDAHPKEKATVDPRILIAAYNAGQGRVQKLFFQSIVSDTKHKNDFTSTSAAEAAYMQDRSPSYQRLFLLAEVYPDFWRLRELNSFPDETNFYILDWMVLRKINQAPETYGIQMPKVMVSR